MGGGAPIMGGARHACSTALSCMGENAQHGFGMASRPHTIIAHTLPSCCQVLGGNRDPSMSCKPMQDHISIIWACKHVSGACHPLPSHLSMLTALHDMWMHALTIGLQ